MSIILAQLKKKKYRERFRDATLAGTTHFESCTLILVEGDSAMLFAESGFYQKDRNHFGIYPISGKLINPQKNSEPKILENVEIQDIMLLLNLKDSPSKRKKKKKKPTDNNLQPDQLRYGQVLIMTDQDLDGIHIKGLLINLFHTKWKSLLKTRFLSTFITPLLKVIHVKTNQKLDFFSEDQYRTWKEERDDKDLYVIDKYVKGLGAITAEESNEYFEKLDEFKIFFIYEDKEDDEALRIAFSENTYERKKWLSNYCVSHDSHESLTDETWKNSSKNKEIRIKDFVYIELGKFFWYQNRRSIPCLMDGLKPSQRKVLFSAFKKQLTKKIKIKVLASYVVECTSYQHSVDNLDEVIIFMAQDFPGTNNINYLQPEGQFGSREAGRSFRAAARYTYTQLSDITRLLFPKDDDEVLKYLTDEDGKSIEPLWYVPIIPAVLVNGAHGIGAGWKCEIPNYNTLDIIKNVRNWIEGKPLESMLPWYKGCCGQFENLHGKCFSYGKIEDVDFINKTLTVTELPATVWTEKYVENFSTVTVLETKEELKDSVVRDYKQESCGERIKIKVTLGNEADLNDLDLWEQLNLIKPLEQVLLLFDGSGKLKLYKDPDEIIREFCETRLEFYEKRKNHLMKQLQLNLEKVQKLAEFMKSNEISIKDKDDIPEGFECLKTLNLDSLTEKEDKIKSEMEKLRGLTGKDMWLNDLLALEEKIKDTFENRSTCRCFHTQKSIKWGKLIPKPGDLVVCQECSTIVTRGSKSKPRSMWLCLTCGHIACGDGDGPYEGHALGHAEKFNHPLVMQLGRPLKRWCFACCTQFAIDNIQSQQLSRIMDSYSEDRSESSDVSRESSDVSRATEELEKLQIIA